jgi:putative aldouronate transport system permease protein
VPEASFNLLNHFNNWGLIGWWFTGSPMVTQPVVTTLSILLLLSFALFIYSLICYGTERGAKLAYAGFGLSALVSLAFLIITGGSGLYMFPYLTLLVSAFAILAFTWDMWPEKLRERIKKMARQFWRTRYLQLLLLPGVAYFIIFQYGPMYGVQIAFRDFRIARGIQNSDWVGFMHFERFFTHPHAWRVIRNTIVLNLQLLIIVFPLPIFFALLLNEVRSVHYKRMVQTISYLPNFIALPAIIGMMVMMTSPTFGMINVMIENLGFDRIFFMAREDWFRPLYLISEVWTTLGWSAIIYIAALAGVNTELYESAAIDGASRWRMMFAISLPSIAPTIIILLLLRIGNIMSLGTEKALLMQTSLNIETSDIISTFVYRRGIENFEHSFSAAVAVFNSIINMTLLISANRIARKITDTSLW